MACEDAMLDVDVDIDVGTKVHATSNSLIAVTQLLDPGRFRGTQQEVYNRHVEEEGEKKGRKRRRR